MDFIIFSALLNSLVTTLMSLPIRYPPMAFYFWLSIIFLTPQILWHPPCQRDLFRPSCNHQRLYPIPHCTISLVPHQRPPIWPTDHIVTFSFLSLFSFTQRIPSWPNWSQVIALCDQDLTICFAAREPCACFTYRLYLRLLYLLWKIRKFSPELRLKFISSHHFASLCPHTFAPSLYLVLPTPFALSHHTKPPSRTTLHSLILHQETISLLLNHTPQNHIGYTLRSPSPLIFVAS